MAKGNYFQDIWKDCEVRVTYALFYDIFQVLEEENRPNKNIYHTFTLFSKKSGESLLVNPKRFPAFSEFHLEKLHRFVDDSCQKLGIVKDILVYFEKYVNAFVFNNLSLLDRYGWL